MTSFVLTLYLNVIGMACLAVGMERHYRAVWGIPPSPEALSRCRRRGWMLLAAALLPSITTWGAGIGVVVWIGALTIALLAVALPLAMLKK